MMGAHGQVFEVPALTMSGNAIGLPYIPIDFLTKPLLTTGVKVKAVATNIQSPVTLGPRFKKKK